MRLLRATTRLVPLIVLTTIHLVLIVSGRVVLFSVPGLELRWRNFNFRNWSRWVVFLLNIKLEISNTPPKGSFLLVSNHLSYLDIALLASQVDCTFIAKSEVSQWPFIGLLARSVRTLFINRNRRRDVVTTMQAIERSMDNGLGVVLFAEGTSTAGHSVAPFKTSLLELASSKKLPVHYASISYATRLDEPSPEQSVCWWGEMTFTDHFFRMLQLSGVEATVTFGCEPIIAADRRELSARLWQAVNAQFTPVIAH